MELLLCFSQLWQFQGAAAPAPETRCVAALAAPAGRLRCSEEMKKSYLGLGVGGLFFRSESYGEDFEFN